MCRYTLHATRYTLHATPLVLLQLALRTACASADEARGQPLELDRVSFGRAQGSGHWPLGHFSWAAAAMDFSPSLLPCTPTELEESDATLLEETPQGRPAKKAKSVSSVAPSLTSTDYFEEGETITERRKDPFMPTITEEVADNSDWAHFVVKELQTCGRKQSRPIRMITLCSGLGGETYVANKIGLLAKTVLACDVKESSYTLHYGTERQKIEPDGPEHFWGDMFGLLDAMEVIGRCTLYTPGHQVALVAEKLW